MSNEKFDALQKTLDFIQYGTQNICDFIGCFIVTNNLEDCTLSEIVTCWKETVEPYLQYSDEIKKILQTLLETLFEDIFCSLLESVQSNMTYFESGMTHEEREANLTALVNRPQLQQRTEEWYLEGDKILTASQFHVILKKESLTRARLILEKAGKTEKTTRTQRLCCLTTESSPFDWGIRFEPIVKQIYCDLTKTEVSDLGRIRHPHDKRLAASPDGVVTKDFQTTDIRFGRFVEFKAPLSRVLNQKVPDEYYSQMQIQMECGSVDVCDYFEVKFKSKHCGKDTYDSTQNLLIDKITYFGVIYLIGKTVLNPDTNESYLQAIRYEYSPLQKTENDYKPSLNTDENEQIMEVIPWQTNDWWMHTVKRSSEWFESVKPHIESFWNDVEKAKIGEFVVPESKRKRKICQIIDEEAEKTGATTIES